MTSRTRATQASAPWLAVLLLLLAGAACQVKQAETQRDETQRDEAESTGVAVDASGMDRGDVPAPSGEPGPPATETGEAGGGTGIDTGRLQRGAQRAGERLGENAREVGAALDEGARELGRRAEPVLSDAVVTARVKARLAADPEVNALHIDVDTVEGRVTLNGVVADRTAKEEAIKLARRTEGVAEVIDLIRVQGEPPPGAPAAPAPPPPR